MIVSKRLLTILLFLLIIFHLACQTTGKGEKVNVKDSGENILEVLEYYTRQGIMTDPGKFAYLYDDLPSNVDQLCNVVQGVILHIFWAQGYGVELSEERKKEIQIRKVEDMLGRIIELNGQPINLARDPHLKVVGNCRDFSLFLCSLLRHKGIPARLRCGFATYFTPGEYGDHWICEYWDSKEKRWVKVDAQLDCLQIKTLKIDFNPHDLPGGKFLTAGETWQLCQAGKIDPRLCGIFDLKGLWFVRGNLLRDFMALNKIEVLPWDCNQLMEVHDDELSPEDYILLDNVAGLTTAGNVAFSDIRALYESIRALRMPEDWEP